MDRVRSRDDVEPVLRSGAAYSPPLIPIPPQGISGKSSIAPLDERPEPPKHRPALPVPQLRAIHCYQDGEEIADVEAEVFHDGVTLSRKEIERLDALKKQEFEELKKQTNSQSTWGTLAIVAQYITNIGIIAFGASTGGLAGALLVGAGVVGLTSRIIQDTGLLKNAIAWYTKSQELQRQISHKIEMGMLFLQMGMGLAGGIWAAQSEALTGAITTLGTAANVAGNLGMSYHDKQMAQIRKKIREIETKISLQQHTQSQMTQDISNSIDSEQQKADALKSMVRSQQVRVD